jgi:hypothetical protein
MAGLCVEGRLRGTLRPVVAAVGLLTALAGPAAYTLSTVATANTGSTPSAGPAAASTAGFPGGGPAGRADAAPADVTTSHALASLLEQGSSRYTWVAASSSAQTAASLELATGKSTMAIGGFSGGDPAITLARFKQLVAAGKIHYYVAGGGPGGARSGRPPGGFAPPGGGSPTGGANSSAFPGGNGLPGGAGIAGPGATTPLGGGFTGGFPGLGRGPGGAGSGQRVESQIQSWVSSHFKSSTVGGVTIYDLSAAK